MAYSQLSLSKADIVVVDDNPVNLRLLMQILSNHGYKVRPVPNGKLALSAVDAILPDLILLDINMPDLDGYEVCEKLKQNPKTAQIPVIFISAYNSAIDKVKAFGAGGVDYIPKPFQVEEVLVRVKNHLSIRFLQQSLEEKNQNLEDTLEELKAAQEHLVQSEKMAALGQLIAGIAHEINTPLGAIKSSINNMQDFFQEGVYQFPQFCQSLDQLETGIILNLLKQANRQTQYLSSRERRKIKRDLSKYFAAESIPNHRDLAEIVTDLGIHDNLEMVIPLLSNESGISIINTVYDIFNLQKSAKTIEVATDKAAKIVFSLKTHARQDSSATKTKANIIEGIETVLTLYQNQLKYGVEVVKKYEDIPRIHCYYDELNQVWTNLIHNALQAMNYQGTLAINARCQDNNVVIKVSDDGQGIPPENMEKIFQPFFTTKPAGEGSGLGLDIVRKIITKHQGDISVTSKSGQTIFTVSLPIMEKHMEEQESISVPEQEVVTINNQQSTISQ